MALILWAPSAAAQMAIENAWSQHTRRQRMRQGCAKGCRVRPWIGLLLPLLMMPPLAAAEEAPFAVAVAGGKDAGHWPFALVAPLEEAPFAVAGAAAKDSGQWPYSLTTPRSAAGGETHA